MARAIAALLLACMVAGATADLTVSITFAFRAGIPSVPVGVTGKGYAQFKQAAKVAWNGAIQTFQADAPGIGDAAWSNNTAATPKTTKVVFCYPTARLAAVQALAANASLLYTTPTASGTTPLTTTFGCIGTPVITVVTTGTCSLSPPSVSPSPVPLGTPTPPPPAGAGSPPPPIFPYAVNANTASTITFFAGDFAYVLANKTAFLNALAAAIAGAFCTPIERVVFRGTQGGDITFITASIFSVDVDIAFNSGVPYNPAAGCAQPSLVNAVNSFANALGSTNCFNSEINVFAPLLASTYHFAGANCAPLAQPPSPFPPPSPPPAPPSPTPPSPPPPNPSSSPPPSPPLPPSPNPPPSPPPPPSPYPSPPPRIRPPPSPPVARRLALEEGATMEPADVAYGTDQTLYEVFSQAADYYAAGSACLARGARLASYASEAAQVFVDILCDGAAGMSCWVEGNAHGTCSSLSNSEVKHESCSKLQHFVCMKPAAATL